MDKKSYSDKLKSPEWQKKRLEILERDAWQCQCCGDTEETLQVHHLYYEKDNDPCDYPDESLITLCVHCHAEEGEERYKIQDNLIYSLRVRGYINSDIEDIANGILNSKHNPHTMPMLSEILHSILVKPWVLEYLDDEFYKDKHGKSSVFRKESNKGKNGKSTT